MQLQDQKRTGKNELSSKNKLINALAISIAFIGTYIFFIKILFF